MIDGVTKLSTTLVLGLIAVLASSAQAQNWFLVHQESNFSDQPPSSGVDYYNSGSVPTYQNGATTIGLRQRIVGSPLTSPPWASWLVPPNGSVPYDVIALKYVQFYPLQTVMVAPGERLKVTILTSLETGMEAWMDFFTGGNPEVRQRDRLTYKGFTFSLK